MKDRNQKIIESKERLAADVLVVAEDALQDIKVCMGDARCQRPDSNLQLSNQDSP